MLSFLPGDIVILLANAALSLVVLFNRAHVPNAEALIVAHALVVVSVVSIARCAATVRPHWVARVHPWLPVLLIPLAYFELGVLIPAAREIATSPWDQTFQAVDVRLLGDPLGRVEQIAWAPLSDLLMVCYCAFYIYPCLLAVKLYQRSNLTAFHSVMASVVCAFVLTYVGYFVFPTSGPHTIFDSHRPVALDGYVFAGPAYHALLRVTNEPPDAFPSGHALIGALVPVLAWRWHRDWVPWLAPLGGGMIIATLYFRFHYVADVVAALLLVPICCWLGDFLVSRCVPTREMLRLRVHVRSRLARAPVRRNLGQL